LAIHIQKWLTNFYMTKYSVNFVKWLTRKGTKNAHFLPKQNSKTEFQDNYIFCEFKLNPIFLLNLQSLTCNNYQDFKLSII